ncbi:tetratricopeptide repeat protein [Amycolatopsis thailandensis]|uniref:tetratricopeptide repeat protein n=1 Tax=Amycolatopsis thailandensis TaxID=589330 RepID=UPI00365B822B
MSRPDGRSSIQDVARARLGDGFVGRVGEREEFRVNLGLPGSDRRRRYLFSVHGLAGVGKSFLLDQLRGIAEETRAAVGFANDSQQDLPATLVKLAKDLARGGHEMRRFEKRHEFYLKARERLHSDPQAPAAGRELLTKSVVKVGLGLAKSLPGGDLAAEVIDPAAAAKQLEQLQSYLSAKFKRQADIRLLLDPAEELTKPFVEDLWRIPESRQIALFFDTFERTSPVLETWLLDLFGGRYGDLPQNLVLTTAGQFPLDEAKWNRHASLLHEIELRPFTEQEARQLLAERGITDERVIEVVLRLSDGLPVLVAMLARGNPAEAGSVGDRSGDAVDRFLHWVPEKRLQDIAATAALPRMLDEDVVGILTGPDQAAEIFRWLRELPFAGRRELPVRYHPVVRGPMVRLERGRSPEEFADRHRKLAEHYGRRAAGLGATGTEVRSQAWGDERWEQLKVEEGYHLLCADPADALPEALLNAANMMITGSAACRSWVRMMEQAGTDADAPAVLRWAARLEERLSSGEGPRDVEVLDLLAGAAELDAVRLSTVVRRRAWAHDDRGETAAAARDYDRAVALNPADPFAWSDRGNMFHNEGDWERALEDLNRAIELGPGYAYSRRGRGSARAELGDLDGAMEDLDEAVRLQPGNAWAYTARAKVHEKRGDLRKAIDELDTAIRLDSDYPWAVHRRAELLARLAEPEEALAGFRAAAALRPKNAYYLDELARFLEKAGKTDEAVQMFDAAVAAEPDESWALAARAAFHYRAGRYRLAIDGFTAAIRLDPDYEWAVYMRGSVHLAADDHEAALADFDRAIELAPQDAENHLKRATVLGSLKRHDEAKLALDRAIELEPGDAWAHAHRARAHGRSGDWTAALADIDVALGQEPDMAFFHALRGAYLAELDRHEEARAELDVAVRSELDEGYAYYKRSCHRLVFGEYAGALADVEEARALGFGDVDCLAHRAEIHRQADEHDKAVEDLREVVRREPDSAYYGGCLGEALLFAGQITEAVSVLRRSTAGADWVRNTLALAELKIGQTESAMAHFERALDEAVTKAAAQPRDWEARLEPVLYLVILGREPEAKRLLADVLADDPPREPRLDLLQNLKEIREVLPGLQTSIDGLVALVPRPVLNLPGA